MPQASVDEGGQALEGEGGHGPRGGNWRSGLLRRLARRGSASPRRGRGSVLGVQRDGQWRGRHSPENVEFRAGNRKDDGAARRRGRPCPESAARRWSPTPRPTTGRFSGSPTSRQSTSFMPANISAKLPTVATDWYDRATLRDARRRQGRRYAISATRRRRKRRSRFLSARFFRRRRMRYASLKTKGCTLRRRPPTRCWSTSA